MGGKRSRDSLYGLFTQLCMCHSWSILQYSYSYISIILITSLFLIIIFFLHSFGFAQHTWIVLSTFLYLSFVNITLTNAVEFPLFVKHCNQYLYITAPFWTVVTLFSLRNSNNFTNISQNILKHYQTILITSRSSKFWVDQMKTSRLHDIYGCLSVGERRSMGFF